MKHIPSTLRFRHRHVDNLALRFPTKRKTVFLASSESTKMGTVVVLDASVRLGDAGVAGVASG